MHWCLRNTAHYVDLPNVDISLCSIRPQKLVSLPALSEKPLNIDKMQVSQNPNFHLKAQFLSLAT